MLTNTEIDEMLERTTSNNLISIADHNLIIDLAIDYRRNRQLKEGLKALRNEIYGEGMFDIAHKASNLLKTLEG